MTWRKPLLLMSLFLAGELPAHGTEQFTHRFGVDPPNERLLKFVGKQPSESFKETGGGLQITVPLDPERPGQAGVGTTFMIDGDFEVTVAYRLVQIDTPSKGYGAGIMLALLTDESPPTNVNLAHRVTPKQGMAFGTNIWRVVKGKRKHDQQSFELPKSVDHGQLRLVRTGSTLRFLVADGDSNEFRELRQCTFGTSAVRTVQVLGDTGGSPDPLTLQLTQLSIRANALPLSLAPAQHWSFLTTWNVLALIGVGALVFSGVYYWRHQS